MCKKYAILLWMLGAVLSARSTLAQTLSSTDNAYYTNSAFSKLSISRDERLLPIDSILEADPGNCPAFILPKLQYAYNGALRHSIGIGINFIDAPRKCDCSAPLGGLCYLLGPTYGFVINYLPFSKTTDISANYGFRYIFAYAGIKTGYAHSAAKEGVPKDFFYLEPSLGFDILLARVTVGYSIRTAEINNKKGSFTLTITASPWEVGRKGQFKSSIKSMVKSSKEQRRNLQ